MALDVYDVIGIIRDSNPLPFSWALAIFLACDSVIAKILLPIRSS